MDITNRITHPVQQGTGPWLSLREQADGTGSEAPAALGVSKYTTRAALLRKKTTKLDEEHSQATLGKFAAGHAAEASIRPHVESIVGEDLFPTTMTAIVEGIVLLTSLDGQTLGGDVIWENKLWNEQLAADVRAGTLEPHYTVQMDQGLLVSGASRCLFTVTDGTPEKFVSLWYEADPEKFAALVAGWKQFRIDLSTYTLPPAVEAAPVGKAPDTLPALRIEVTGQVTASNLAEFKATALDAIRSVNRTLTTDADFADAEKAVKWCSDVESRIAAAKDHALSQTASIDALFKALDDIAAESKRVRLDLDKLVTRRKGEVRDHAVMAARAALDAHIATLNAEIAPMRLRPILADFAGAIKSKRSVASMQDALDGTLTTAKIAAEAEARAIRANVATFSERAAGLEFLFADLGGIIHKAADDFAALLTARIETHRAAEVVRENQRREAAAASAQAAQSTTQPGTAWSQVDGCRAPESQPAGCSGPGTTDQTSRPASPTPRVAEPATLNLGAICGRLGFTVSAAFLADVLHVRPAATDKKASLFTESQFATICRQLQSHVSAMAELYAGEPA